ALSARRTIAVPVATKATKPTTTSPSVVRRVPRLVTGRGSAAEGGTDPEVSVNVRFRGQATAACPPLLPVPTFSAPGRLEGCAIASADGCTSPRELGLGRGRR